MSTAGILAIQSTNTVNPDGDPHPSEPLAGLKTWVRTEYSLINATHALLVWNVAAPDGSTAAFSDPNVATPTITHDVAGLWTIILRGYSSATPPVLEATYILPLIVEDAAEIQYLKPANLRYAAPATIPTPPRASITVFPNLLGVPSYKDDNGRTMPLVGGVPRIVKMADADVTVLPNELALYFSTDQNAIVVQDEDGNVYPIMVLT
jgi:hypothetical protein